jgi:hypothetical protein
MTRVWGFHKDGVEPTIEELNDVYDNHMPPPTDSDFTYGAELDRNFDHATEYNALPYTNAQDPIVTAALMTKVFLEQGYELGEFDRA